jgi:drug/metabolite transporter (DMT)-like permease
MLFRFFDTILSKVVNLHIGNAVKKIIGQLGLLYCAFVWGTGFFIVKDSVSDINPVFLIACRFLIASILMFFIVFLTYRKDMFKNLKQSFVLALFILGFYMAEAWGLSITTAINGGFIAGLFILFVPIYLRVLFKQKLSIWQWIACFTAVLGLWILTGGISGFGLGDFLVFLAAPCYAAFLVYLDKFLRKDINFLPLVFNQFWMISLMSFVICIVFDCSFKINNTKTLWYVGYLALFLTFSAFFVQMWSQKHVNPIKAGLIISLVSVFGAVFSWTYGGEKLTIHGIVGGLVIFSAILISELSRLRQIQKEKTL